MNIKHINSLDEKEIEVYIKYNEPQLLHYNEPGDGVFIAETPAVIERAIKSGCKPLSFFIEEKILETDAADILENFADIPVFSAPLNVINKITGFNLTRGMLSVMMRPEIPGYADLVPDLQHIALFEDIENPTNVGALFRSAAALGADAVILTEGCADPLYRRAARVSMGTVFQVPWIKISSENLIHDLKKDGFTIISMALSDNAIPLNSTVLDNIKKSVVVFGNESTGISDKTLSESDFIVNIPMQNGVDSLNVAAAGAVAFWRIFNT